MEFNFSIEAHILNIYINILTYGLKWFIILNIKIFAMQSKYYVRSELLGRENEGY